MIKRHYIIWSLFVLFLGFSLPLAAFLCVGNVLQSLSFQKAGIVYTSKNILLEHINKAAPPPVSLLFVGDIMLGRGVEQSVLDNEDGDFSFLFKKAKFIKDADIVFGNLEGPIANSGKDSGKEYSFRFKPKTADALFLAGFDALSVANNHAGDWGREAFKQTISILRSRGILAVGGGDDFNSASRVKIIEKNGIRIGFLGFSDVGPNWLEATKNKAGILIARRDYFVPLIKKAAQNCDLLIVSLHFGKEYEEKANKRQKELAHLAIDSGAKIVVGHHPHVVQEVEQYRNGVIAYSLGNFIFDQNFSKETMEGLALEIFLEKNGILSVKQIPTKINRFFQPELLQ